MLVLNREDWQTIIKHALAGWPNEACGLLAGEVEGEHKKVRQVYLLTNLDQSPEHFSMDPVEQFAAVREMRRHGWVMLGNFHSHPASPARPSAEDMRLAFDPAMSYVIVSLQAKEKPIAKSFRIKDGTAAEEVLLIRDNDDEEAG